MLVVVHSIVVMTHSFFMSQCGWGCRTSVAVGLPQHEHIILDEIWDLPWVWLIEVEAVDIMVQEVKVGGSAEQSEVSAAEGPKVSAAEGAKLIAAAGAKLSSTDVVVSGPSHNNLFSESRQYPVSCPLLSKRVCIKVMACCDIPHSCHCVQTTILVIPLLRTFWFYQWWLLRRSPLRNNHCQCCAYAMDSVFERLVADAAV